MRLLARVGLGFRLVWRSLRVVAVHRGLVAFPVVSWLAFVGSAGGLAALLAGEVLLVRLVGGGPVGPGLLAVADLVVVFGAGATLTTGANVALVNNGVRHLRDEQPRGRDAVYSALGSFDRVLLWGVISSSVGPPLYALERLDRSGRLLGALLGGPWSTAAFFALPVIAFEAVRPTRLFDRGRQLYRKTWGLTDGASLGVDLALGALAVPVLAVGAYARTAALTQPTAELLTAGAVVGLLALTLLRQVAVGVSKAALYVHATTGRTPPAFEGLDFSLVAWGRSPKAAEG